MFCVLCLVSLLCFFRCVVLFAFVLCHVIVYCVRYFYYLLYFVSILCLFIIYFCELFQPIIYLLASVFNKFVATISGAFVS